MTIYDIVRKVQMLLNNGSALSTIDRTNLTSKLINDFEANFKIVPKEEFGVVFNRENSGRLVCGGFESIEEAQRYKEGWYKKATESIEEALAKNPNAEIYECSYLTVVPIVPVKNEHREWFKFNYEINKEVENGK